MANHNRPIGKQFREVYVEKGDPSEDSPAFRNRVYEYLISDDGITYGGVTSVLAREFGLTGRVRDEAMEAPIAIVLSLITAAFGHLVDKGRAAPRLTDLYFRQARRLRDFVARALVEEHLAYEIDEAAGVHPKVDAEFQQNRRYALAGLNRARYKAVAVAFQSAFDRLTVEKVDTKAAVRDIFEATEIFFKLIGETGSDLTEQTVGTILQPIVQRKYSAEHDSTKQASSRMCSSFGKWAAACHPYRHGHGVEEPVAPPLAIAVLLLSQGASFIRWLVEVDPQRPAA